MKNPACRCCSRCGAVALEGGAALALRGELLLVPPGRVLLLCSDCREAFQDWLRGPREARDALYPDPARAYV